jgi:CubicO group peptidase (beta-lactamase class C family)
MYRNLTPPEEMAILSVILDAPRLKLPTIERDRNMKTKLIIKFCLVAVSVISNVAIAQAVNIDNWQKGHRAYGLANITRIAANQSVVNAEDVFPLNLQARDYAIHELPSVARVLSHPAVSGLVVMTEDGDVLLEHYSRGNDRDTIFSSQSATKSVGYLLLNRALKDGKIRMDTKVEQILPEVGTGFHGRTIQEVASMAVYHNLNETLAYEGDPAAKELYDVDERAIGHHRNPKRETLSDFITLLKPGGEDGSNEWQGEYANYASINTIVLTLEIDRVSDLPVSRQVRNLMHDIGGEKSAFMATDFDGVPALGTGFALSTLDSARYCRLLIADKDQVSADIEASKTAGQPLPSSYAPAPTRYYKSAMMNQYGIGHTGWGGQLFWADPESGVIIAINGQLMSKSPASADHFRMIQTAAFDIVRHQRAKKKES